MNRLVRAAAIEKGIRSVVICPSMIYGKGMGLQPDSDQLPKIIALSKQAGAGVYFGKGLNRYSNVHIDDLVDLYLLALEKAPGGSFFFAENGDASFKEIAEMVSRSLGFGGRTVSLNVGSGPPIWGCRSLRQSAPTAWWARSTRGGLAGRPKDLLFANISRASVTPGDGMGAQTWKIK